MNFEKILNTKQYIKKIIKNITKEENEDLEQEICAKIFKNGQKYQEKGTFKSWISKITKNTALDYVKSSHYKVMQSSSSDDYTLEIIKDKHLSPEEYIINLERRKRIIKAINNLKPKFKEVIILTEFQDYTYEECAKKLKCPIGTIKSRIFNAKKELIKELQDLL